MVDVREVSCRPRWARLLWFLTALGAAGAVSAAALRASTGVDAWLVPAPLSALVGLTALHRATASVHGDAHGLRSRTLLRRRSVPWSEVAQVRVRVKYAQLTRGEESRHVSVLLRDGRRWELPLPHAWTPRTGEFEATLDALRALHRRHGDPEAAGPSHLAVVSARTAGRTWLGSLAACALLLAGAGLLVWEAPGAGAHRRAWESAAPCTPGTRAADRGDCLGTVPAVIERTEGSGKKTGRLYFTDGRPLERLTVSSEAAGEFRAGDRVRLTVWRGEVKEVASDRHVWRDHTPGAGDFVMIAAGLILGAGYPAARILLRIRGRHRPDDEALPTALPFAVALAVTALWLLPLCYLHPMAPFATPTTTVWTLLGTLTTLALLVLAWRATRIRPPGGDGQGAEAGEPGGSARAPGSEGRAGRPADGERFLPARFLEATDYNPHHFGTHVVVGGGGPPAVVPHPGPGRFAARPVPVSRLTLGQVRGARGTDPVPGTWHVAELDDAGTPVRLAADPADLTRILRELTAPAAQAPDPTRPDATLPDRP